jgi:hypothetical protein
MGLLDKLFGHRKQRTMYDDFLEAATPIVVSGYRRIAARRGCAPGPSVSDAEIIAIYQKVGTAFQDAARARGEILPAAILNNVVLIYATNINGNFHFLMSRHYGTGAFHLNYITPIRR